MKVSEKSKVIYLLVLLIFTIVAGLFWLDFVDLIDINKYVQEKRGRTPESVLYATDDEPSLLQLEEYKKQQENLRQKVEELDRRQALIEERERQLTSEFEKIEEAKAGLELEKQKLEDQKNRYKDYRENVIDLANKIQNMPPNQSVEIIMQWDDPLIIDVLRQMDENAELAGTQSITAFLISLMPKERSGRIMYLMTQI